MRISVFVGVTIDGFLARGDGSYDFLKPWEGHDHGYEEFMRSVDVLVVGRSTYDTVLAFDSWPWIGKRVVVLTHRPITAGHGETTYAGPLTPLAERLASEGVQRAYLDGGIAIRQGLDEDLVDEMTISTVPVTIGAGRPLFGGMPTTKGWKVIFVSDYPNGLVQVRYERDRSS